MSSNPRVVAWTLGTIGALACVAGGVVSVVLGTPHTFLLVYANGVLMALLGALVAAREPRNPIGWLMIAFAGVASLVQLPGGYGYAALVLNHGSWPLGSFAAWLDGWVWVPAIGFVALIALRFPDGALPRRGRLIDWVLIAGIAGFSLPIALATPSVSLGFMPLLGTTVAAMEPYFEDPVDFHPPAQLLAQMQGVGIVLILLANIAATASLVQRYRAARGDERLQIKWFAYAGALCAAMVVYAGIAWNFFGQPLYLALTPLEFAALTLPAAIGIAILRYRLYDIDLIINRTLVYGSLTAILGAVYAAVVTLLNRFFISVSGQKSDAAYVVTAFVVVIASSPIKDWLQRQVDRRVRHANPATVLDQFRANVDAVVSVIDVNRVARRLLDQAITAFDARGAALYLSANGTSPVYSRGQLNGGTAVEVTLRFEEREFGRLVMGGRRGDLVYTEQDRAVLQRSADAVGEALALANHLGFQPLSRSH